MLPTLSPALLEAPDCGVPVRAVEAMAYGLLWKQWPMF
jgi:hypothetical protein